MNTTVVIDFMRYGCRAIGTPKYADITPHHLPNPRLSGVYDGPYVNTYNPERESLLVRIFDERDPTATAVAHLRWIGVDGEKGKTFLIRQREFQQEQILIPDECVDQFYSDLDTVDEFGVITQDSFTAVVRGVVS